MIHTYLLNMTVIWFVIFIIIRLANKISKKRNILKTSFCWIFSSLIGCIAIVSMLHPFEYNGFKFDLRSAPIFYFTYMHGWKAGLISIIFPSLYLIATRGNTALFEIVLGLIPVIVAEVTRKKEYRESKEIDIRIVNIKDITLKYMVHCIIRTLIVFVTTNLDPIRWLKISSVMIIISILSLVGFVSIINDAKHKHILISELEKKQKKNEKLIDDINNSNIILNTIINIMPAGVLQLNSQGEIIKVNGEAKKILRNNVRESVFDKNSGYSLHNPDGSHFSLAEYPMESLKNANTLTSKEVLVEFNDGTQTTILGGCAPLKTKEEVLGAIVVFQDISELKDLEEKIKNNCKITNVFLNGVTETLFLTNEEGIIIEINKTGADRLGLEHCDIIGEAVYKYLNQEQSRRIEKIIDQIKTTKTPAEFEGIFKDRYLRNIVYPVFDDYGNISRFAICSQDITKKKRITKKLEESEKNFRAAFENSAIGKLIVSLNGKIIKVNKAFSDMLGYSSNELKDMDIREITHQDDFYEEYKLYNKIYKDYNRQYSFSKRYIHRDGYEVWVDACCSIIVDSNNKPMYALGEVKDITEVKESQESKEQLIDQLISERSKLMIANKELETANKAKDMLIANVSHELRTPLNIIMSYLEYILDGTEGRLTENQRQFINIAYNNSERLRYLINDMIDFSGLNTNKMEFNSSVFNLNKFIKDIINEKSVQIDNKEIVLKAEIPKENIIVQKDSLRLRQVVENLLDNAIKFTEKGKIIVLISEFKNEILISVRDTGIGIKEYELEKIFEPFYQSDSSFSKKYKGIGLGLSIMKKIIDNMGGSVEVRNNTDKGCTFTVKIPRTCYGEVK